MEHLMSRNFNGKNSDYRTWTMHAHQSQPQEFGQYMPHSVICSTGSTPAILQMPQH